MGWYYLSLTTPPHLYFNEYGALFCPSREEAQEYIEMGSLNGLFVLGRTVGFIGKRGRSLERVRGEGPIESLLQKCIHSLLLGYHFNSLLFLIFIGHYLDQKRLKQGLYRHPWDDISYLTPQLLAEFS